MIPYYLLFFLIFSIAISEDYLEHKKLFFFVIGFLLIIFAGMRSSGVDLDYEAYRNWFEEVPELIDYAGDLAAIFQRDPGYQLACSIFKELGLSFELLIFTAAFLAVTLKMRAIWKLSPVPMFSVLIYFSYLFILQEMTQIRAGLAAAIFLSSIPCLGKRQYVRYLLLIMVAATFHYSSLILLMFVFMRDDMENPKVYLMTVVVATLLAMFGVTADFIFLRIADLEIDSRLSFYAAESTDVIGTTNILNSISIPNLLLSVILLLNFEKVKNAAPYASYVIRIHAISVIMFFALSGYPVMAFRLSELIGVVGILAWPLLIFIFRAEWVRVTLLLLIGIGFLISTLRVMQDYSIL